MGIAINDCDKISGLTWEYIILVNLLLGPLILAANLVLFFGREVVLDIEGLANLFRGLALDHVCDGLAADVKEGFNVEIIGSLYSTICQTRTLGNIA